MAVPIVVAYGDGIGPEIMESVLDILSVAGAKFSFESIEVGEVVYKQGWKNGIRDSAWEKIAKSKAMLKAPITTPSGGGYRSLNVTMRQRLRLYANVRPSISYDPYVKTKHPKMNVVVVRENEEDSYPGIEYRRSFDCYECIKVATGRNSNRIAKYAFDYALKNNRKLVSCFAKDNIMKMTDGIFYKEFAEVALQYPTVQSNKYILDIGAARLANRPEDFDVVVATNLAGDVISDITAECAGSVGLAGSANIGDDYAMFEAVHGSAPDIAGKGIANPSGLLNAAIMMLQHFGQHAMASRIYDAWLAVIESGLHTADIYSEGVSKRRVTTKEFTAAIKDKLSNSAAVPWVDDVVDEVVKSDSTYVPKSAKQEMVGFDVSVSYHSNVFSKDDFVDVQRLSKVINGITPDDLSLCFIASKGLKLWPDGSGKIDGGLDYLMLRFSHKNVGQKVTCKQLGSLLNKLEEAGLLVSRMDALFSYDDVPGFAMGSL